MEKCIVKENGYHVKDLIDRSEAVLVDGNQRIINERNNNYRLVSNDVHFYWGFRGNFPVTLKISYKDTELERYYNPSFQVVINYLNQYENLSKQDIEKLVIELQEDSKTQLESEIEDLKIEKEKLLEQISIMKQIDEKKEELKLLLTKLND